jgi:N4-(beta-N-acetylglucosaminyl)-L-asparaginase
MAFAVIATWPFGQIAVRTAIPLLRDGRPALDAAIAGAQDVEDDPVVHSVGFGGLANSVGTVSLDACVMDGRTLGCGAVASLENVRHPAALARRVMERTPHILLVGEGARLFAVQQGFPLETLLTPESVALWNKRRPGAKPKPEPKADARGPDGRLADHPLSHDTVTVLALDEKGSLGGVCTTSGLAHKLPGRVGDSPLIGSGLYVDNSAGAAGATGVGEEIIRIGGSFFVVERMRAGRSPQEACEDAVRRVNQTAVRRGVHPPEVAFIALDPKGRFGASCTAPTNFQFAVNRGAKVELQKAEPIPIDAK